MRSLGCAMARGYIGILLLLCSFIPAPGRATSHPKLVNPLPVSHTVTAGQPITFQITYKGADIPGEAYVDLLTPQGQHTQVKYSDSQRAAAVKGDPLITTYTPVDTGTYRYQFYVQAVGDVEKYPADERLEFNVRPNWFPYAIIAAGFLLSFLVISTLIYQVLHRGMGTTQHNSARVALMIGGICWTLSVLYAMDWLTNIIAWVGAGVVILLLLVWALIAR